MLQTGTVHGATVSDELEERLEIRGPEGWSRGSGCCGGNLAVGKVLDETKALLCG